MPSRLRSLRSLASSNGGFTITELVVVIAVLGVVAGIAGPRFFSASEFDERFFSDELHGVVGHARKLAVATGCEVQITIGAAGYLIRQRATCLAGAFSRDVANPSTGAPPFSGTPPPGLAVASTLSPVFFDALGRARDGGGVPTDFTVTVGTRSFTTVGETGFVQGGP